MSDHQEIKPGTRQELILEVLAARTRLKDYWYPFSTTLRKTLEELEDMGLIVTKSGIVEGTIQANLTETGIKEYCIEAWDKRKFKESISEVPVRVVKSVDDRWDEGVDHDPRSEQIFSFIRDYDYSYNDDKFGWKSGGDGDNGEELMYLLDEFFANKDKSRIYSYPIRIDVLPNEVVNGWKV